MIGMLLDQQVPMEWAFTGPFTLRSRLGHLDATRIASMREDDLVAVACERPAIHGFPASMARRIHALCIALDRDCRGKAERIWNGVADGDELYRRLRTLPGFGDEKAKIFIALLAKRFGVQPAGWERAAGVFADDQPCTVASNHRGRVTPAQRGRGGQRATPADLEEPTAAERRASMTWAQRPKRVFGIDIATCRSCGGAVRIIA